MIVKFDRNKSKVKIKNIEMWFMPRSNDRGWISKKNVGCCSSLECLIDLLIELRLPIITEERKHSHLRLSMGLILSINSVKIQTSPKIWNLSKSTFFLPSSTRIVIQLHDIFNVTLLNLYVLGRSLLLI